MRIFPRQSASLSGSPSCFSAMEVMPRMAFIGVRMSWLIRERNSDLAWFARRAPSYASSSARLAAWSSA